MSITSPDDVFTCPDCQSVIEAQVDSSVVIGHDDSCPFYRAVEQARRNDRRWFRRHRDTVRVRPIFPAEVAELRAMGVLPPAELGGRVTGMVRVTKLGDLGRSRNFSQIVWTRGEQA